MRRTISELIINDLFLLFVHGCVLVIKDLNESQTDAIIGPCRKQISIAAEGLQMPYICTTSDPDAETFTFELLPVLSDFIEAMAKLVYGRFRQGSNKEYKTIIYEGNKGKNTHTTLFAQLPWCICKCWSFGQNVCNRYMSIKRFLWRISKVQKQIKKDSLQIFYYCDGIIRECFCCSVLFCFAVVCCWFGFFFWWWEILPILKSR